MSGKQIRTSGWDLFDGPQFVEVSMLTLWTPWHHSGICLGKSEMKMKEVYIPAPGPSFQDILCEGSNQSAARFDVSECGQTQGA